MKNRPKPKNGKSKRFQDIWHGPAVHILAATVDSLLLRWAYLAQMRKEGMG
ncbi:ABC transporter ATP-binding protein [Sesbania bispinosa]|nr:ABC transporter ATP-binding protein [Sesbania bispinosa]